MTDRCTSLLVGIVLFNALALPAVAQTIAPEAARGSPSWGVSVAEVTHLADRPVEVNSDRDSRNGFLTAFSVGARTWLSWADSDRNYRVGRVDVGSELKWRNMASESLEINASAMFLDRVVVNADFGMGGIHGGHFRDQDFL